MTNTTNEITNNDNDSFIQLFKSVFFNIVILNQIYTHVRLYKKNECVVFESREELINYKERDYIQKIQWDSRDILNYGDLSIGSNVLKQVEFNNSVPKQSIKSNIIPIGVEILIFSEWEEHETLDLSTFPSTIHTVKNIVMNENTYQYQIPHNITSISFTRFTHNISIGKTGLILHGNLKSFESNVWNWINGAKPLKIGDLPNSLTNVSLSQSLLLNNLEKGVLPNSLRKLSISLKTYKSFDFSEIIPENLEILIIDRADCNTISRDSNFFKCTSITELLISFEENSLPSSITKLTLMNINSCTPIKSNAIPNSVLHLILNILPGNEIEIVFPNNLQTLIIDKTFNGIFPNSLTDLELSSDIGRYYEKEDLIEMLPILPLSLVTLKLPLSFSKYNLQLPNHIKNII